MLTGDEDPVIRAMRVDKAPSETYAEIGGLESQVGEMLIISNDNNTVTLPSFIYKN